MTVGKAHTNDRDAIDVLPLSIVPLKVAGLRKARIVKNSRLEGMIELFSERESGSGQIQPHDLPKVFEFREDNQSDLDIVERLCGLPSYDVYSLRILLRHENIAVDQHEPLKLSAEAQSSLEPYMHIYTRPLIKAVYGHEEAHERDLHGLMQLFADPNTDRARQNLARIAEMLEIELPEVPTFLEDYADVYLSLAYYQHHLEEIDPRLTSFVEMTRDLRVRGRSSMSNTFLTACDRIEEVMLAATTETKDALERFRTMTVDMWDNISPAKFEVLRCGLPAAATEAWLDGHNRAFVLFGGVPQSILYDNDKCLVSRILSDGTRQRTRAFSGLQSHYLFEDRYGRPGKGNDKGNVEGVVGYARRNFMTPLPRFASWDAFNGHLEEQCRNRQGNVLRGHRESIGERFVRDREALKRPLPAPFDACDKQGTRVNSLSLVRYRTNDYSVPVAYGHQEVWIRGYVHEVVIGCGAGIIARHPRSYDREDMVFDPIHYLPLLEHKIGALDQAAPLAGWELPDAFPTLRRLLEAHMGKAGKREYVQVLRLLETFDLEVLHGAVKDALRLGAIGYDAVKHLVLCRIERRPPKLDLDIYPYLPRANVATTAAASYMSLLGGGAS